MPTIINDSAVYKHSFDNVIHNKIYISINLSKICYRGSRVANTSPNLLYPIFCSTAPILKGLEKGLNEERLAINLLGGSHIIGVDEYRLF